jgi:phosphatidylglycerophosphate synthase
MYIVVFIILFFAVSVFMCIVIWLFLRELNGSSLRAYMRKNRVKRILQKNGYHTN